MMDSHPLAKPHLGTIACAIAIALLLAGCAALVPEAGDDCETYPDREELKTVWKSFANDSFEDFDVVSFQVQHWHYAQHAADDSQYPPQAVRWEDWPASTRPALINDLLCYGRGVEIREGKPPERVLRSVNTAEAIAEAAMAALRSEAERQGVQDERCCYLEFRDEYYGVGYSHYHLNIVPGPHVGARTTHHFEGHVERQIRALDQSLVDDSTEPFSFYVKQAAKVIQIEADWDQPEFALELLVSEPTAGGATHRVSGGTLLDSTSPLVFTMAREDAGTWRGDWIVTMRTPDAAVDVDYRIAVTIFNWEREVPAGYTAL